MLRVQQLLGGIWMLQGGLSRRLVADADDSYSGHGITSKK